MRTQVIAEVGECFNGNFDTAIDMVCVAADAGCDVVKFQLLDMAEVAQDDPEYDWFSRLSLPQPRMELLIAQAEKCDIDILFTPVSIATAADIYKCGQKKVKIASSFVRKQELLEYINTHFEEVYLSTGMAELEEVRQAVELLESPRKIKILHCISEYPTGPLLEQRGLTALQEKDAHLAMISILKEEFPNMTIGYSDHTDDIFVPVLAAAMGAEIIEKHITMDREEPIKHFHDGDVYMGTDHVLSIEPEKLCEMVQQIRRMEEIRGEKEWKRTEGEMVLRDFLRGRYQER